MPDDTPRWNFEKVGLGYRCWADALATEFRFTHIKRSGENLTGELAVSTHFKGIKTNKGLMHLARFNVLSSSTRHSLAGQLGKRSPGIDIDWADGLEHMCQGVIMAEHQGTSIDFIGQDEPMSWEDNFLLEPFVLSGRPSMIFGPGGVGKSLLGLTCAVSVKTGTELIPGAVPHQQGPVLYLDWETNKSTVNDRIQAICKGHGIDAPKIAYRRCIRPLYEDAERLAEVIAERGIILVVIDSAAYAMGGTGERGMPEETVLRMHEGIRLMGCSALIIDHVTKVDQKQKPGTATPYGSAYKTNAVRLSWEVRSGPDAGDGSLRINCYQAKSNDTEVMAPLGLSLDWGHGVIRYTAAGIEEAEEAEVVTERKVPATTRILELTAEGAIPRVKLSEYLSDFPTANVYQALKRLRDRGEIVVDGKTGMVYQPNTPVLIPLTGGRT
jgi:hypothetical protein